MAALLACSGVAYAQGDTAGVPRHLSIARELVDNIKPEDNQYVLGGEFISFPGDLFSSKYSMKADCSGFLLAVFERAGYPTRSQMTFLKWSPNRKRARAEDFLYSIENEKGYRHIRRVEEMRPGDLLAHAMLSIEDQKQTGTTGHVFLINSLPKKIAARRPVIEGTTQYEVSIIDSNEEHVGDDDSRLQYPANKLKGLGQGTIRVYSDSEGEIVGWARTFRNTNRFFSYNPRFPSDTKLRRAALGRPVAAN
jgi:cell wall-associated NlpC family hydrolase